jgi:hypothetical protein
MIKRTTACVVTMILLFLHSGITTVVQAQQSQKSHSYIAFMNAKGAMTLSAKGTSAPLWVSAQDFPGVLRAAKDLQQDIARVTSVQPALLTDAQPTSREIVIIGTLGKNPVIDKLVTDKKLNVDGIAGQWEAFVLQVVERPLPNIDRALVIAGSDKRGTTYGIYDLSSSIGVSPWCWWADVPVKRHAELLVLPGRHIDGPPSVKYRGIFLNDEAPDLTNWVRAKFGTVAEGTNPPMPPGVANYGHEFYEKLFELILRLKGNYLWPAMWNNAFNEDDPENPQLADLYGIVMGTSHQEPMLRAQKEWDRRFKRTLGSWNYAKYPDTLQNFWREGIRRNKNYESIITMGLRGADDTPMAPGGPEENMTLLENIVGVQRKILTEEVNADVTRVPQMWCLYKEVLDFYNIGMRVPDDVTLLWPDDNWGNVRRLPTAEERKRSGGAGVYYHFDYHGGPRSYQWLDTNPIAKVWEQMSLAKQYGADRIWIVNVGHFKGYEFPLEYFMNLAWNSAAWSNENIEEYTRLWAERTFGAQYAKQTAEILLKYTQFNGRRKPELLRPPTYSLVNYQEAERVVAEYNALATEAEKLHGTLPSELKDAFYELILFPTKASALVNELYVTAGKNALYAKQGRSSANEMAARTRQLFDADTTLMGFFNRTFAGGKWEHFMDQSHLGYTTWQDPPTNSLRAIELQELQPPNSALMGVAVEASESAWPGSASSLSLPLFDSFNRQQRAIEIFNRGTIPFDYSIRADAPWIRLSSKNGTVANQATVWLSIDWTKAPKGRSHGAIAVKGTNQEVAVNFEAFNPTTPDRRTLVGFVEGDGVVSMEAEHFTKNTAAGANRWIRIPRYGRTLSGMSASGPVDAANAVPDKNSPCLEYKMYLFTSGKVEMFEKFGAALNFIPGRGVRYAISIDDETPQTITLVPEKYSAQNDNGDWEHSVVENGRVGRSTHTVSAPGFHTLKIWMIDPGVVLERIAVNLGGMRESFLGPPESYRGTGKGK